jgi:hypothetical protein
MEFRGKGIVFAATLAAIIGMSGCGSQGGSGDGSASAPKMAAVVESFSPASDSTVVAGAAVRFTVKANENAPLSYTWSIDGVQQPITAPEMVVDTTDDQQDVHRVAVEIHGSSEATTSIIWKLRLVPSSTNVPPVITDGLPAGPVSITCGDSVQFSVFATDSDVGDVLIYAWSLDGYSIPGSTETILLDSTGLAEGEHAVVAVVSDGHEPGVEGPAQRSFPFTVLAAPPDNRAPVIEARSPESPVRIAAGSALVLGVTASDPDGNDLVYRWTVDGAPQAEASASFQYAPGASDAGLHAVEVRVDDRLANSDSADPTYCWWITVEAQATSGFVAELDWQPVTTDVDGNPEVVGGYRVYVAEGTDPFDTPAAIVAAPPTGILLASGATYRIAVSAYDAEGNESLLSEPVTVQIP